MRAGANIYDTVAAITSDYSGRPQAEIITLAGNVGEKELRLYPTHIDAISMLPSPYLGFKIHVSSTYANIITISVDNSLPPPNKGDEVFFILESGQKIVVNFMGGRVAFPGRKVNVLLIDDLQLMTLYSNQVESIAMVSRKTGQVTKYMCAFDGNHQYANYRDGMTLFSLMIRNLAGAKVILTKNHLSSAHIKYQV